MNKCIFCGMIYKEPTKGLHTKTSMKKMCIILLRMAQKNFKGEWTNTFVEIFAFGNMAIWAEKKLHKGMKLIAICTMYTSRYVLQPEVGKTKTRVFYKPCFILDEFFSTETKDFDDYAQERNDAVFAGFLGETMVDMAKYEESRRKNDFDYSKESRRYRNKVEYPKDKEYYNDMLDNIADNADMSDIEMQGEEKG